MGCEENTAHGQPREDEEPSVYEFSQDSATGYVWLLYKHGVRFGEVYNEGAARKICDALNAE